MPQTALTHMMLALKVLNVRYGIIKEEILPAEIELLKSYVGNDGNGLALDQIACEVIEKELKKLKARRARPL